MRNFQTALVFLCIGVVTGLGVVPAPSQIVSCTLTGTVVDPSGSAVASASVTATNADTNLARTTATDATGRFVFPALPPGHYTLTAGASGFVKQEVRGIILEVGQTVNRDFHLALG